MNYRIQEICAPETTCRIEVTTTDGDRSDLYMSLGGIGCGRATNPDKPNQVSHNLGSGYGYGDVRQAVSAFREAHDVVGNIGSDPEGNIYFVDSSVAKETIPGVVSTEYDMLATARDMVLGNTPLPDGLDRDMVISAFAQGVLPDAG